MTPTPTASAEIVAGKKTNRVRVTTARRTSGSEDSPQRGLVRYRRDPSATNHGFVKICISLPAEDLHVMDELGERVTMSRSHLIRQAVKYFAAYVDAPGEHHQRVHDPVDLERIAREIRALRVEVSALAEQRRPGRVT